METNGQYSAADALRDASGAQAAVAARGAIPPKLRAAQAVAIGALGASPTLGHAAMILLAPTCVATVAYANLNARRRAGVGWNHAATRRGRGLLALLAAVMVACMVLGWVFDGQGLWWAALPLAAAGGAAAWWVAGRLERR